MISFLVVFERSVGRVIQMDQFGDKREALRGRFTAERRYQDQPDVEVVVLNADSEESLRRTHARYFESVSDMATAR